MLQVEITEIWIVFACHCADNISISFSWSKVSYFLVARSSEWMFCVNWYFQLKGHTSDRFYPFILSDGFINKITADSQDEKNVLCELNNAKYAA